MLHPLKFSHNTPNLVARYEKVHTIEIPTRPKRQVVEAYLRKAIFKRWQRGKRHSSETEFLYQTDFLQSFNLFKTKKQNYPMKLSPSEVTIPSLQKFGHSIAFFSEKYNIFHCNIPKEIKCFTNQTEMEDNNFKANQPKGEIEEIEDEVEKRFKLFKNFDIHSHPPPDHHFNQSRFSAKQFDIGSTLALRVIEEWKILNTGLPDSICVRAYKWRIDLMRAVIVGLDGTPYSDGLFFFDVLLPSSYPAQPPKLFYHSHGLDVNPYLHTNGKVCLSFLKTCDGCKEEKWNPKQSTMLQVLVSIQDLVLNANLYLNEPGCIFYQKQSLKDKDDIFTLTCQTMLYTLKMPPRHFEEFVTGHFRMRAHQILMNCRACMDISESIKQLFLCLIEAFEENGTYCKHHISQVKYKEEPSEQKSDNNGFEMKIWGKLKNLLDV